MSDKAMEARIAHIEQLENITEMCSVLDAVEEELEEIAKKNRLIGHSCDAASKVKCCSEIAKHLDETNLLIQDMSLVLHKMDNRTLRLLKDSI